MDASDFLRLLGSPGAGLSALADAPRTVGLSALAVDPMGDATAALEARRRQQIEGAGYDPDVGLYDRYSAMLGSVLGPTIAERSRAAADAMRRGDMAAYQKLATDLSMDFGNFLGSIKPIRAYHGSPHDFDKFSMDKIGTGEGAQAYGHGLYFAEREGVAKAYRDKLSRNLAMEKSGVPVPWSEYYSELFNAAQSKNIHPDQADNIAMQIADLMDSGRSIKWIAKTYAPPRGFDSAWNAALEAAAPYKKNKKPGRMYEVNIHADPERFLDWDKPLGDQSEQVRRALGWTPAAEKSYRSAQSADTDALLNALLGDARYVETRPPVPKGLPPLSATGGDILKGGSVFDRASDPAKSAALRDAGIPGIKYLDQGSRAAGDGSRNYVVFDDKLIEILRKYGIMAPMAGGGIGSLYLDGEEGGM